MWLITVASLKCWEQTESSCIKVKHHRVWLRTEICGDNNQFSLSCSCRNINLDEEGTPTQLGGLPTSVCEEDGGMMMSSEPAECLRMPQCNPEAAARWEVEEEGEHEGEVEVERCRSREKSPERAGQSCSEAGTDALLPKQQSSSQEGEVTPHSCKRPKMTQTTCSGIWFEDIFMDTLLHLPDYIWVFT